MSVINKMLQELDRRNAVGGAPAHDAVHPVKPVGAAARRGHEWFWRVLAALVLVSLAWVAWVAYQLQPRPLVTPLALMAAEQRPIAPPAAVPVAVVEAPKREPVHEKPEPEEKPEPIAPQETFKLARSIETPIREAPARAPKKQPAVAPAPKVVVDKRERAKGAADLAEARFRRAAALLGEARLSEAEEHLAAALQADASHVPARQAYVALLLEQQRVPGALRLLREAVDANPAQPVFSLGLARVHAGQQEYAAALTVLDNAGPAARGAEFQVLRAAVLQRLGRHAEAVASYQDALQKSTQPGATWAGLGISLEALGRAQEAMQAYQRALHGEALPAELRDYAEGRIRALQ